MCEGDIEEADGILRVFCPWHDYDFDLRTGKSGTSLKVRSLEPFYALFEPYNVVHDYTWNLDACHIKA